MQTHLPDPMIGSTPPPADETHLSFDQETQTSTTRRDFLQQAAVVTAGVALAAGTPPSVKVQTPIKRIYLAPDDHTDYVWSADEETYRLAFLDTLDYYLDLTTATLGNLPDFQSRWNCDGSLWMWTYEKNRSLADFENNFIARLRSGHLSSPLNTLVGVYGGTPLEGVLRSLYYAGRIERRYNLRFPLVAAIENQVLPYGLGALWAGAGARYTWHGVCACATRTPNSGDREHQIYWWTGPDGSRILMKWQSLFGPPVLQPQYASFYNYDPLYGGALDANMSFGGYAECRYAFETVDFTDTDTFKAKWPYAVIGAFGQGWDNIAIKTDNALRAALAKSDATRRVIVSNETDFFQDFEAQYGANLPTQAVTFGNEWELAIASQQEVSSSVKRAVEKLRAAEALATLVSLKVPGFLDSRTVSVPLTPGAASLPPGYGPVTARDARDLAFLNLGLYYEHDYCGGGPVGDADPNARPAFNRRTAANIVSYVDDLYNDAANALGGLIVNPGTNPRFYAFNPLGWTRTDYADFPYSDAAPVKVIDVTSNTEVPSQRVTLGGASYLRVLATSLPPLGYKVYEIQPGAGQTYPAAATVSGRVIQNTRYRITLADDGAIVSLKDRSRNNREFAAQTVQAGRSRVARVNDLGYPTGGNYTSTITAENVGPVSVTLKVVVSGPDIPLDHVTCVTLFANSARIEIRNEITQNFGDTRVWDFGFNLTQPDTWYEEVGAIIRGKLTTQGGHYSPRNARYDWQTLNHFADLSGSGGVGVTLSNWDCHFMKIGNSTLDTLDTQTAILSPLAGGLEYGLITNQNGDSYFLQRFAVTTRRSFSAPEAMRFALEHQNPPVTGAVTGGTAYPATSYSLLKTSDSNALIWAVKPAEEGIAQGIIARVWNLAAARNPKLTLTPGLSGARATTHIETNLRSLATTSVSVTVPLRAQQIATFRLLPRP